jgi:hypothetical protein
MSIRWKSYSAMAGVLAVSSLLWASAPAAQNTAPAAKPAVPGKSIPRLHNGRPNFNGFWIDIENDPVGYTLGSADGSRLNVDDYDLPRVNTDTKVEGSTVELNDHHHYDESGGFPIPYNADYMAKVKASAAYTIDTLNPMDPYRACKPLGITRVNQTGHHNGFQIVQTDDLVALLYEEAPGPAFRTIYLDGRPHPESLDTSFMGHSIGHWEGDTLVVDVTALNDETLLDEVVRSGPTKGMLLYHSDKEHVIERWTRTPEGLRYEATVDDVDAFTKPWVIEPRNLRIGRTEDFIQPQMCVESTKSKVEQFTKELRDPNAPRGLPGSVSASPAVVDLLESVDKEKKK